MSISDWANIAQDIALIYFGYQQNQIFKQQNQIFAKQEGRKTMPSDTAARFLWIKRYWPTIVMISLMIVPGYDIYDRHRSHPSSEIQTFDWTVPLIPVHGEIFVNERVEVDGKEFIDCTFNHVTLSYNGTAPFSMSHSTIIKPIQFASKSDSVSGAAVLFQSTGVLEPGFDITSHHKPLTNIQPPVIK